MPGLPVVLMYIFSPSVTTVEAPFKNKIQFVFCATTAAHCSRSAGIGSRKRLFHNRCISPGAALKQSELFYVSSTPPPPRWRQHIEAVGINDKFQPALIQQGKQHFNYPLPGTGPGTKGDDIIFICQIQTVLTACAAIWPLESSGKPAVV